MTYRLKKYVCCASILKMTHTFFFSLSFLWKFYRHNLKLNYVNKKLLTYFLKKTVTPLAIRKMWNFLYIVIDFERQCFLLFSIAEKIVHLYKKQPDHEKYNVALCKNLKLDCIYKVADTLSNQNNILFHIRKTR